jgi:son of sevenless-like protein
MYVKADALTFGLREQLENAMGEDGANMLLYNLGRALGMADCKFFSETYGLTDPSHRLFTGPIYFNYAGWAFVKFLPSVNLSPDEDFLLTYDHLNSFEATGFLKAGKKTDKPVCHINTGYSSGWVSEAFGLPLISREITCEAKGDKSCRFVMAHKKKIMEHLENVDEFLKL